MSRYSPFLKWGAISLLVVLVGLLTLLILKRAPQETIQQSLLGAVKPAAENAFDDKLGSLIGLVPEVGGREPVPEYVDKVESTAQFTDNFRDTAWLVAQGDAAYTVQVMAASNIASVNQFFANQPDPNAFTYFQTTQDGDTWYVVSYGVFSSREQALGALNTLALETDSRPFPKRIGSYLQPTSKPVPAEPAPSAIPSAPLEPIPSESITGPTDQEEILPEF